MASSTMIPPANLRQANPSGAIPLAPTTNERAQTPIQPERFPVKQQLAAQLELLTRTAGAATFPEALQTLVEELQRFSGCTTVCLGLLIADYRCRLEVVSHAPKLDKSGETVRQVEDALQEAAQHGEAILWQPQLDRSLHPAHRHLALAHSVDWVLSIPLVDSAGRSLAIWTFIGRPTLLDPTDLQTWLSGSAQPVGIHLELLQRAFASPWTRFFQRLSRIVTRRWTWCLAVSLLLLGLCFIHLPYQVSTVATMQPVVRRFVAAPFQGQLDRCLVKPGDLVKQGQPLANMDGRDLRSELASQAAEAEQAAKDYDVNLASGKLAAAQVAGLEIDRLKQRRNLLERRIEQLAICCPVDGVILSGDLEGSESAPVNLGQPLFEVAPLDILCCEIEIPDSEIAHVHVGQSLKIVLDAFPARKWTATLERLHPRSEIRTDRNVFIAQVNLDNTAGELRPGMKGQVRIATAPQSLGWIMLHKPWEWLCAWGDW